MYYITIITIANHFLLALLLLFAPRLTNLSNKILAGQLISIGVIHYVLLFVYWPNPQMYKNLIGLEYIFGACLGPFIYLYSLSYIKNCIPSPGKFLVHFLLPILFICFFILFHSGSGLKQYFYNHSTFQFTAKATYIADSITFLQALLYIGAAVFSYLKAKKTNNKKKAQIQWLKVYFISTVLFGVITAPMGLISNGKIVGMYASIASLIYFCVLLWQSLSSSAVFNPGQNGHDNNKGENNHEMAKILAHIKDNKQYTNKNFSLEILSEQMQIPKHQLSAIINCQGGITFLDLINHYRIEDAKQKLLSPEFDHFTIEGIASEVGFHSRSSFYDIFRKKTGKTPSEFRLKKKLYN